MIALFSVLREPVEDGEDLRHRALIAAVMQRAIVDWVLYRGEKRIRKRRLYHSANSWLYEDDRRIFNGHGITFPEACAVLGADPEVIRTGIRSLTKDQLIHLRRVFSFKDE